MQEKYKELLEQHNVKTTEVARATGIPYNTLNDWRKGKTKKISAENLEKLAEYFGVSTSYFYASDVEHMVAEAFKKIGENTFEVAAGQGRINSDYESGDYSTVKIVGESMYPVLMDGDIVKVEHTTETSPQDLSIVKINGDESTCKHIEIVSDGVWLRAENKEVFEDKFYTVQEVISLPVSIIGKAVEIVSRKL